MLDTMQMSDLLTFQQNMEAGKEKELLHLLLWEYRKYAECGTIEDCQQRKEWMEMSIEDIREKFAAMVKGMREEVEYIRDDAKAPSKRGRPPKRDSGFCFDAPHPLGTKFYVLMHGYIEEQILIGYKFKSGNVYLISDCGEWWEIGVNAWLTWSEANEELTGRKLP